jgi:hypothetical protein
MRNYSNNSRDCRVDFFKEGGKWYTTEAVSFAGLYDDTNVVGAFREALKRHLGGRLSGMWAVCLDPYSERAYPLMVKVD